MKRERGGEREKRRETHRGEEDYKDIGSGSDRIIMGLLLMPGMASFLLSIIHH